MQGPARQKLRPHEGIGSPPGFPAALTPSDYALIKMPHLTHAIGPRCGAVYKRGISAGLPPNPSATPSSRHGISAGLSSRARPKSYVLVKAKHPVNFPGRTRPKCYALGKA